MRETPIYEQLRGEAITADVASHEAASAQGGRSGRRRQLSDVTDLVARWAPPRPDADLGGHQHPVSGRADQPSGATQRAAAVWRLRATLPRPAHARPPRTPATSSPLTATSAHSLAPDGLARNRKSDRVRTDASTIPLPPRHTTSFAGSQLIAVPGISHPRKKMIQHTADTNKRSDKPSVFLCRL